MPRQEWMPSSKKPPVHTWLQPAMDDMTKNQLRVAGNVVIPKMAYVAANALANMAHFNLETIGHWAWWKWFEIKHYAVAYDHSRWPLIWSYVINLPQMHKGERSNSCDCRWCGKWETFGINLIVFSMPCSSMHHNTCIFDLEWKHLWTFLWIEHFGSLARPGARCEASGGPDLS